MVKFLNGRRGNHLDEDDIFTVEVLVRMSDIDQVTIDNSVWFVKLGVSNNGQVICFDL